MVADYGSINGDRLRLSEQRPLRCQRSEKKYNKKTLIELNSIKVFLSDSRRRSISEAIYNPSASTPCSKITSTGIPKSPNLSKSA